MAAPAAVLSILVRANTGSATTGLIRFNQQLDNTEKHSHKAARAIETVAKAGALIGGAAVVGGMAYAVKKAADFEQQMSSLGAVADASGKQMERFRKQALRAGADTKFSALEAAQAQTELAKGGLTVAQIMKGGLRAALGLAAAGEMDLADAATATVNAMKLFGLRGKDAMKVADGFATAANRTTADVKDFAMALSQGGSAAKAAGLSFTETVATLEALAEVGIKNSDAGTSMKTALIQLASPTIKASGVMDDLNLKFFKANGEMKSIVAISDMLRKKTGDLTREQRLQAFTTLVGTDGMRALLALYDAGPKKIQGFERGLQKQGTAADVAKKKQDNLAGSIEQFRGSIETLAIQVGMTLIPTIRTATDELTGLANGIGKIIDRKDLTLGEKLQRSLDLAKVRLDPWVDKLKDAIDRANVPEKLAAIISAATPLLVKAAAQAGVAAAKTFIGAFAQSDMWGKLVLGGWLFSRMGGKGGFFKMGAEAGGAFGAGMQTGMPAAGGRAARGSDPANRGAPLAVAAAAGGVASKAKGLLKTGGKLAGKFAALDLAINLVDSKGNLLAAGVNTAHDLTFGVVPKIHVKSGSEKTNEQLVQFSRQLDDITKKRDLSGLDALARKLRGNAEYARSFKAEPVAKEYDKLANKANRSLGRLMDQERNAKGASGRFADSIRGLQLSGSKDFGKLVSSVTSGSRQILRIGGGNTKQTQQEISHQFSIARTRVKQSMDAQVISVRQGTKLLHTLAVKELGLYGIKAGRVNVVLAKGANGQMRPNARGGFQHTGEGTGDSIPSMLERGEYVVNRKAVQKVGKDRLDALNFGMAPRFQKGGLAGMQGGGSVSGDTDFLPALMARLKALSAAAHTPIFVQSGRRTVAEQLAQGPSTPGHPVAGPNGPHVQGIAADITPGFSVFGRLASKFGLGFTVMPQEPWHIQLLEGAAGSGALAPLFKALGRPVLQGPPSVALEAGQGALDRIRSAANSSVRAAFEASFANGSETNFTGGAGGAYDKAALKALWVRANGGLGDPNLMAAIALAESGGNPGAHNPSGATGLWQILGNPFPGNAYDPVTNARMAGAKLRSQGLGAWEAYTNGNYRSFLQRGGIAGMAKGGSPFGARLVGELNTKTGKLTGGPSAAKLIRQIGNTPNRKLRRGLVSDLLSKVKDVGLPEALRDRLSSASGDADVFDDYANRAESIGGPVNGKSQSDWLGMELDALFRWRNAIIEAQGIVAKRRKKIAKLIKLAQKKLAAVKKEIHTAVVKAKTLTRRQHDLQGQLRKAKKHPKANKTLIAALGDRLDVVRRLLGGTTRQQHVSEGIRDSLVKAIGDSSSGMLGRAGKLKETAGTLGSSLTEVQGLGSPTGKLRRLPTVGVLGGRILDTQMLLKGLAAPTDATDTSGSVSDGTSDTSAALAQLLQQANLRTAVSEAQFKVFRDMPPYGGAFATGGVVPGGVGEPRMAVVHGGEGVFTPDQMAAIGGSAAPIVNVHVDPAMAFLQKFIRVEVEGGTRRQARSASRALPGRPGSLR